MTRVLRFFLVLFAIAVTTGMAEAQTSYITGSVMDSTGTGIQGATVSLHSATGVRVSSVVSTEGGSYRISGIAPGTYTLRATHISYTPFVQTGVVVVDGAPTMVAISMSSRAFVLGTVVSVEGVEQKITEAPASVHVIGMEQIAVQPTTSPVEHIRNVPGIDIAGGGLWQRNVVARGFNNIFSGSLLTLTDNRFAFVPSLRVNVPYLNPTTNEDIERIEVVLGPGSALYGPNAASGVMHILTRSPFDSEGTTVTVDAGNQSVLRGAIRHAAAFSDRLAFKASFEAARAEDWTSVDEAEQEIGVQRDFDLRRYGGELRVDFRPTDNTEVIATYGRSQAGSAIEPTGLGAAQVRDWVFNSYQLRASSGRLFGQVFLNTSDAGETFLLRNRNNADRGVIVDKSTQLVAQLQHSRSLTERIGLTYGLDYQLTTPKTEGTINGRNEDDDDVTEYGGYLHATTQLTDLIQFVAATRVDKHNRLDDPVWSPRAAVVFQPTENQGFRLTYNRAFSTPSTNNLFLDLQVASIPIPGSPAGGYFVRTLGTPSSGFQFRRDCTGGVGDGLCMRSPFVPGSPFMPANAGGVYKTIALPVAIAGGLEQSLMAQGLTQQQAQGIIQKLQGAPAPTTVGTQLRVLNPTTARFDNVPEDYVRDLTAIEPTITNSYEAGYRGFIANRVNLSVDVWQQRRENFVGPLIVETPNVFLDSLSLATYLTQVLASGPGALPAAQAAALGAGIAAGMAGTPNAPSAAVRGIPIGVVNLDNPLNNPTDIVLAYRNFGTVDLWGADFGADVNVTDAISVMGTFSYANKDFFKAALGSHDIALNAPGRKGSIGARYRSPGGFGVELRNRWVAGFPANSGVYIGEVPSYSLMDLNVSLRPSIFPNAVLAINAMNILDEEHIQFIGGGTIGRLIVTRLQYTF